MSRVLKSGENQITQNYASHVAKVKSGNAWAQGTDVVKKTAQLDYIIAHSEGTVIKVVNYIKEHEIDKDGMGYGNYVVINHGNGYATKYAHLKTVDKDIIEGKEVKTGQVIGYMGNTGNSFGAHLHFEVIKTKSGFNKFTCNNKNYFEWINPEPYLDKDFTPTYKYEGFLDSADNKGFTGWCWNGVNNDACNVVIKIFSKDNKVVKTLNIKADMYRADLKAANKGNGKCAYNISIESSELANGTYTVKAYAPDNSELTNVKTITIKNYKYEGFLDSVIDNYISGWCWNGVDDTPCTVTVKIYKGTSLIDTVEAKASECRADLKAAKKGNGKCAYNKKYDFSKLGIGTYTVKVFAPSGVQLNNSKSVIVDSVFSTEVGTPYNLKNTYVYNSETTKQNAGIRTGTWYIYKDNKISNGRIKMTNKKNGTGVSFFCNISDLKNL